MGRELEEVGGPSQACKCDPECETSFFYIK